MKGFRRTTSALLLLLSTTALADEWPQATAQERSSANGQFSVRVTPGNSWGEVGGFAGKPKGDPARAEWYRFTNGAREKVHSANLLNPIAPVDFVVTDNGTLVTFDNWHNVGTGYVLVIYRPDGQILRKLALGDLYSYRDTRGFGISATSILWRCFAASSTSLKSPQELWVEDVLGGRLVVRPDTGTFSYQRGVSTCTGADTQPVQLTAATIQPGVSVVAGQPIQRRAWSGVTDGLQLQLDDVGKPNAPEDGSFVDLNLSIANVSDTPIRHKSGMPLYNFEYEIDGTWYAFPATAPVPTLYSTQQENRSARAGNAARADPSIEPGLQNRIMFDLPLPLTATAPTLQLRAITAGGPGVNFEPTPGTHILRIRPGRLLDADRRVPTSAAVTIALQPPATAQTPGQVISFARNASPGNLRFAKGPAGDQAFIRNVLARPPGTREVARVFNSASLQVFGSLPYQELKLPYYASARDPSLPTTSRVFRYLVRGADQSAAMIELAAYTEGPNSSAGKPVLKTVAAADSGSRPLFDALLQLGEMERIRRGNYEPRLLQLTGDRGMKPMLVIWLHSSSGKPDLFYRPHPQDSTGLTKMESGKLYATDEFFSAVRALPLTPRHDAAWAIATAMACAGQTAGVKPEDLVAEKAEVETGVSGRQVAWYVFIPKLDTERRVIVSPLPGAALQVLDGDGSCTNFQRR